MISLYVLAFLQKSFWLFFFFFFFYIYSKLKYFKGSYLCKFGEGFLNSLKFIHGKINTKKAKNKPIIGLLCRLTECFMNSEWNLLPFRLLTIFCNFFRDAILVFKKKTLFLVWRKESNLRKKDKLQQKK